MDQHDNFGTISIDCIEFLKEINLEQYAAVFLSNFSTNLENGKISIVKLTSLQIQNLPDMNINNYDHQIKIMDQIKKIKNSQVPSKEIIVNNQKCQEEHGIPEPNMHPTPPQDKKSSRNPSRELKQRRWSIDETNLKKVNYMSLDDYQFPSIDDSKSIPITNTNDIINEFKGDFTEIKQDTLDVDTFANITINDENHVIVPILENNDEGTNINNGNNHENTASIITTITTTTKPAAPTVKPISYLPLIPPTSTLKQTKMKEKQRRKSFDESAWNSIAKLRGSGGGGGGQSYNNSTDNSPQGIEYDYNGGGNSSITTSSKLTTCGNNLRASHPPATLPSLTLHNKDKVNIRHRKIKSLDNSPADKAQNYGNAAQQLDIIQVELVKLQSQLLSGLKETVGCEVANVMFLSKRNNELVFYIAPHWYCVAVNESIAGACVRTRTVLHIIDAYSDPRFNRNVDDVTGFHTRNILCHPIHTSRGSGDILGVLMLINKISEGGFDDQDERFITCACDRISDQFSEVFSQFIFITEQLGGTFKFKNAGNKQNEKLERHEKYSQQTASSSIRNDIKHHPQKYLIQLKNKNKLATESTNSNISHLQQRDLFASFDLAGFGSNENNLLSHDIDITPLTFHSKTAGERTSADNSPMVGNAAAIAEMRSVSFALPSVV